MPDDLAAAMRQLADAMRESASINAKLLAATQEAANENRALRNELRTGREKQVKTRRVKTMRAAINLRDVPVDDIAAALACRALAKHGG